MKAVPAWRRIRDNPEPYVRKVMVNENISRWWRRRWREIPVPDVPDIGVDTVDSGRLELAQALAALAPRQRGRDALERLRWELPQLLVDDAETEQLPVQPVV